MRSLLVPLLVVGTGLAHDVRQLRAARRASPPRLQVPPGARELRCHVQLGHFGDNGGGRGRDRAVITQDLLHLDGGAGLRVTLPRTSVTAVRRRHLAGALGVGVEHNGVDVVGPEGPLGFRTRRSDLEAFLSVAVAWGWPVRD